ncbi:MAG TPA: helix-turn-helix domain-containing protein [Solirubrobacteraceae bacterium]|nr:helix-turn-helix domain-containing protein [Solirubrobacteraceae bacterium]
MSSSGRAVARTYKRAERASCAQARETQRTRIVWAMIELASEAGVERVSISRVVARARVSTRTFYELFEDRDDCLLAAIAAAYELARERALAGYDGRAPWVERVRGGLRELLGLFDEEPQVARLLVVHSTAAGPAALRLRSQALAELARVLDGVRADLRAQPPPLTAEATVGAVASVLHSRLLKREHEEPLSGLLNSLMSMVALPYLGASAARRELSRSQAAARAAAHGRGSHAPSGAGEVRLTSRTIAVLRAIGERPGASNREVAERAGVADQGQASRLLARLCDRGLLENTGGGQPRGAANAWRLTHAGERLERALAGRTSERP